MQLLILGATGRVGTHLVSQALDMGHEVTALVRNPANFSAATHEIRIIQGDVLDGGAVDRSVLGQDAVVYSIGADRLRQTKLFSDSTRSLIAAMKKHDVKRLVAITGVGAGDSKGHGGFVYDRITYPLFTRPIYQDKDRQEALIRMSELDWIIVRPAPFTNGPRKDHLRAATDLRGVMMSAVSRADTAAFVLEQLTSDRWLRQTPLVGY